MPPMQMDWGLGHYESTAEQLLPAAVKAVEYAAPQPGEPVVDVGCGTGNAALRAAELGARVTGVDPAPRLLEVARKEAVARGLDAVFVQGDAAALPLADASADLVLSVFGVIFAPDAQAAAAEMARVTAPGGRIVLTAWIPEGALIDCVGSFQAAAMKARGIPPGRPGFAWHDLAAVAELLGPFGFSVTSQEEPIIHSAPSAREWLDRESANHPLSVAARAALPDGADADAAYQRGLEILEAGNEAPHGFRLTTRYVVTIARRQ